MTKKWKASAAFWGWLLCGPNWAAAVPDINGGIWEVVHPQSNLATEAGNLPPLLPAAKMVYEQHIVARAKGDLSFDGAEHCLPPGLPRLLNMAPPFEFLQRPEQIIIHYQWNRLLRLVDMNVPQRALVEPTYLGQSVGSWSRRTLTIDTVGFNDSTLLDTAGLPHGSDLHLTEQYQFSPDLQNLTVRVIINDPQNYAHPWSIKLEFHHDPHGSIAEDVCLERKNVHWGPLKEGR